MATQKRTCSFEGCERATVGRGLCNGHWQQQRRGADLSPLRITGRGLTDQERLDRLTDKSGECWLWTGSMYPEGYGQFHFQGKSGNAHRAAYILSRGPISSDLVVDHKCHNRACVRPDHLQAVTNKQNLENIGVLNSNNSSGERGVSWNKARKKWAAQYRHNGRIVFLGRFDDYEAAVEAVRSGRNRDFTNNLVDRGLNIG